ncbi:MAG TPA: 23S rRNA (guanosine(2251)-2'-O)-methyltransferase RlmB [Marinospirillum sp.]|uniref:23S rRNA (guanosine(2251)-2'-O)-methyltransferase RlmB n=1 Tax=Marinospirillum sp. TaxID=2183934 RepID=UPI002B49D041|nr:23S rRNA (guanosine(2251)-2'-O)-methyltransferase RlmB [Marinospirillum sp.]HKM16073.1 23S rRNA (guanosine(2251)-2'-O)-methyltransferase RlmB [Marinospirillum sp.]
MNKKPRRPKIEVTQSLAAVFGFHAVESLIKYRVRHIAYLWAQQGRDDTRMQGLLETAHAAGVKIEIQPRETLDKEAGGGVHQGIIAWVQPRQAGGESDLERLLVESTTPPLLLVLDGVTDPHNLGACMRSAEAAGAAAVIVPKDKSAGLNATVRKVACGATETLPLIQVTNLARTLRSLADYGVWIIGTAGEAEQLIYQTDLTRSVALVMGAEGRGMRRLTREVCNELVKLPMAGEVSSLNVSVASGVALYEAVRQRL